MLLSLLLALLFVAADDVDDDEVVFEGTVGDVDADGEGAVGSFIHCQWLFVFFTARVRVMAAACLHVSLSLAVSAFVRLPSVADTEDSLSK